MNAVVEMPQRGGAVATADLTMDVREVLRHATLVQQVMQTVMKGPSKENPQGVHYGKIPGTPKPTLYKPGAEVLCMTFRIDPKFKVEDLSTPDAIRYRVTCAGIHQTTGIELAEGLGEASTSEEKYKWRGSICDDEFDATPVDRRRVKFSKGRDNTGAPTVYKTKQIRTEPADLANTVLKMAVKRAHIAMVLNALAASDMFTQDLEDMEQALRDHLARSGEESQEQPQAQAGPQPWPDDALDARKAKVPEWQKAGKTAEEVITFLATRGTLSDAQKERIRDWFTTPAAEPAAAPTDGAPKVTYAALADRLQQCKDADSAAVILDEGRALPADQQADLQKLFDGKFPKE